MPFWHWYLLADFGSKTDVHGFSRAFIHRTSSPGEAYITGLTRSEISTVRTVQPLLAVVLWLHAAEVQRASTHAWTYPCHFHPFLSCALLTVVRKCCDLMGC